LVYTGQYDFVTNSLGLERWMDELNWNWWQQWNKATSLEWKIDNKVVGTVRNFKQLTFVNLYNSGHHVSRDQPKATSEMIRRFIKDVSFN